MHTRHLVDGLSVAPQITLDDVAAAAAQGFRSLVSNRPDGEEPGQPTAAEVEAAARDAGLAFRWLPVTMPTLSQEEARAFATALEEMPGPTLAFCRTGTRSTALWALSQAGTRPTDEIVSTAAAAGYDLEGLRPRLDLGG
ncbi:MAG: TIGR01244 family phosphatase [Alphaproteobacteria bacterium]|nr:TIGR01244 family phosphatase [Alphaproteobacteria bacterium]MBU1525523.1 TIGR01244 family phosphatase [Alphaproteobacteria bacterium]MBU2117145.1 TIGR01244 family phosphatase [Alphaproteobacteria bacterium]MBU2350925.1 TIGR01244 family phosphatase [Alphaproteobacteria bacterium]MBU2383092.1 TIGR01244 family phosphatase [Alphaproteobacteria bacterium]